MTSKTCNRIDFRFIEKSKDFLKMSENLNQNVKAREQKSGTTMLCIQHLYPHKISKTYRTFLLDWNSF